ncbi:hypothetical protein FRC03_003501 [Tulasnella sp. 419]|nr:hypothetical protein FRC03_003501 [Tulasnella sp. 419]
MVVLYNTARKTAREIDYGFRVRSTSSVAHSLSPDGKTLVRWVLNEENQASTLLAIDVRSKRQIAKLQQSHKFQQSDLLGARWIEDSTIYIPISAEGIIIAWNILKAVSRNNLHDDKSVQHEDLVVLRPFSTITRHRLLKFEVTKDRAWWIATGTTLSDAPSGLIEVRDVENDESRIIEGMLSCIAEVKISDKEKALLVSAGVTPDFQLRLCVQQVDPSDSGQPFIPVDVKVDIIEEKDYPRDIIDLHPLPIVAVMTEKSYSYFFELHSGAYLYSRAHKPYRFCPGQSAKRELLLWSHEKSDVQVLTVNVDGLVSYCRKVLKDDSLAEAIASRTGLRGAENIILDDI